ncbi:CYTH and CHAD domain-containing protein [Pseudonocardia nigra]|uniref:CYTH and CHAD domain-containing protein n=1 Tax=Pseudonocardia nigra TaxID=1921578 RepID=UPI001C5CE4ED|nr:CYTH and CHAD domain-containing protein [Pseudonocardia nigra]
MTDTTTRPGSRTYRGPAGAGSPRLAALPGVHREEIAPQRVLEVERYDTDDHRLTAAGIALAVHRDEETAYWRLDLPDGGENERLRVPLASEAPVPPPVPSELAELVRGAARDREVRPAGRVRRVRTGTALYGDGDALVAEVVHDHVTLATLGAATEVESWTEVELHPAGADGPLLREVEQRIIESGLCPAVPSAEAELERLLRPAPPARRRTAGRRGSAGAVLVEYLATHLDRLAAEDLRVRRGGDDGVHQMRVAARRIRSALQAYRPLLDRERTDPLVDGLRELGRALAPARDAEVLHERIAAGLAGLGPGVLLGPVQAQVTRHFARVEAEARAAVLTTLDSEPYARLRTALDDLLERPPLTKRAARPARKELPALAARAARRMERAVEVAIDPTRPAAERDVAVHSARKAGKRLRYAVEVARPAVGKQAKRFASELKGFQKALGEHQDIVVARDALRELGALAHSGGENGFSFGLLHGRDTARAERIEEELPRLWAAAWTRRNRRWLR